MDVNPPVGVTSSCSGRFPEFCLCPVASCDV